MDSKWLEEQKTKLRKQFKHEFNVSYDMAQQMSFQEMTEKLKGHDYSKFDCMPIMPRKKKDALEDLKSAIEKLAQKYKQDSHALTLLGDLDKSRVYNGIANQLDLLLKGGA